MQNDYLTRQSTYLCRFMILTLCFPLYEFVGGGQWLAARIRAAAKGSSPTGRVALPEWLGGLSADFFPRVSGRVGRCYPEISFANLAYSQLGL